MRVAIYARVSTDRGEQDPMVQVEALRLYLAARGDEVVAEFVDHVSGARAQRPALGELLHRMDEFDAVAVVKLDRLARSVKHLIQLAGDLEANGVDLIVKDQAIDTSTPVGKLMFHVLGAIAEFERDLIRERTKAGIGARNGFSRRGKRLGRPRRLDDMQAVYRAVKRCGSVSKAARELGVPRETLRDALARCVLS